MCKITQNQSKKMVLSTDILLYQVSSQIHDVVSCSGNFFLQCNHRDVYTRFKRFLCIKLPCPISAVINQDGNRPQIRKSEGAGKVTA